MTEENWTNIQVDSQILSTFMRCPRKMNYIFNEHLIPIFGSNKGINKGQLSHIGIHGYWKARIDGADYQQASIIGLENAKKAAPTFVDLDADSALDVFQNLIQFFKYISNSLTWQPVFVEQHFRFVAYEDTLMKIRIILTGRIDLGLRTPAGLLVPIDNKSESERWFYSAMSNQFKIYCLACKVNTLGVQRFGFQKSLKDEDKFKMELIPFDPDYLEEFRTEVLPYYCKQMLICKEEGYWPPNYASCINGHFGCEFSDKYNKGICNISREVRKQKLDSYFSVGEPWNPENF